MYHTDIRTENSSVSRIGDVYCHSAGGFVCCVNAFPALIHPFLLAWKTGINRRKVNMEKIQGYKKEHREREILLRESLQDSSAAAAVNADEQPLLYEV